MGRRSYRSEIRSADAAATRTAIRDAGATLFVRQGFAATSMRQIASEAGVGERTVYAVFNSKFDLYHHALDVATVGDEEQIAVRDRPEMIDPLTDPDPARAVAAVVAYGVDLLERAGDLIWVGVEAAGADAAMRELSEAGRRETHQVMLRFTTRLAELGALRPGLDAAQAADILHAMTSPHTFHLLRRDAAWSADQYRAWITEATARELFGGSTVPHAG